MSASNPLTALLDSAAGQRGGDDVIVDAHRSWTPAQLLARADALAICLEAAGVRAGDRVLIRGKNSGDVVARIFAAWRLGALAVPMHAEVSAGRFARIVTDAMPSAYVGEEPPAEPLPRAALPLYTAVIVSSAGSPSPAVIRARSAPTPQVEGQEPGALLMYTSGSTAAPLGVLCPEASIHFALNALHEALAYDERDRVLCVLPLAFDYGLYQVLLALKSRAVLVLEDGLHQPFRLPRMLAEQAISIFPGLPSIFGPLLRAGWLSAADHRNLRMLTSTGEHFPPAMIDALRSCLPGARLVPMYGLTECKRVSIQGADVPDTARYSVGRALPGTQAWVGDAQGRPKPPGQEGELFVRGPHLMAGYWRNRAATAARYKDIDGQRTLQTGDIFRTDEAGYLSFVRREGGFLKANGERLSPAEIEACLVTLPQVREAVAVGYSDPEGEDSLAVFLVSEAIDEARVRQHCARHLQRAAVPSLVRIYDEPLPRSPNGKYDRAALAALAQELSLGRRSSR